MDNGYTSFVKTKFICSCCGKPLPLKEFYKSSSRFNATTEHLSVCKECFLELFKEYSIEYNSRIKAMQRICMAFDIYFDKATFISCDNGTPSAIGNYFKRLNLKNFKNYTFDNVIEDGFYFSKDGEQVTSDVEEEGKPLVDPSLIKQWGKSLQPEDYEVLDEHYKFLKSANKDLNDNQEIYITELCYTKMFQMRALRSGDTDQFGKMSDNYRKTFTQAGLKAVREIETNSDDCWGVWTQRIEEYTPAEYYKNKSLFKDFDGIGSYIERFMLRPLRNLMHGTNDRDYEYSVKDEDGDEVQES